MLKSITAWLTLAVAVVGCLASSGAHAAQSSADFDAAVASLATSNFKDKEKGVIALGQIQHANTRAVLAAMLDGSWARLKSAGGLAG